MLQTNSIFNILQESLHKLTVTDRQPSPTAPPQMNLKVNKSWLTGQSKNEESCWLWSFLIHSFALVECSAFEGIRQCQFSRLETCSTRSLPLTPSNTRVLLLWDFLLHPPEPADPLINCSKGHYLISQPQKIISTSNFTPALVIQPLQRTVRGLQDRTGFNIAIC